ncbi:MAG: hydrogenase maturation protease [Pseudomonadota bacterium]
MTAPILVFGWGNPARGDDALGPLLVEWIAALQIPEVECLTDFQLQVEHALDLEGRQCVLFVDASLDAEAPFTVRPITPAARADCNSHTLAPEAVLQVYIELQERPPPPCQLLAIHGESFELGTGLSAAAKNNLAIASEWVKNWLSGTGCQLSVRS